MFVNVEFMSDWIAFNFTDVPHVGTECLIRKEKGICVYILCLRHYYQYDRLRNLCGQYMGGRHMRDRKSIQALLKTLV